MTDSNKPRDHRNLVPTMNVNSKPTKNELQTKTAMPDCGEQDSKARWKNTMLNTALVYCRAVSIIPVEPRSKLPAVNWKEWQKERASEAR